MLVPPPNWYLRWRAERLNLLHLSEKPDQSPPEALLQQVWLYQRLIPEKLRTVDGRRVRVLHPGFWNLEAGPDFRQALIQVGDDPPTSGDIEIDILPAGWEHHAHANNPAYRNVVLHVTWEPESAGREFPSVSLKHALDASLPELSFWLGVHPRPAPAGLAGQCAGPLRALPHARLKEVLTQAAQARLRRKAEALQARARQAGWEGALWEGLLSALGYKRNVWPMRRLGELRKVLSADLARAEPTGHLQSRLFGVAGLLPSQMTDPAGAEGYLRALWQNWWRESAQFRDYIFPKSFWNLAGIRPANHPQRRIALAAHWLADEELPRRLEAWLDRTVDSPDLLRSLGELLEAGEDPFWSYRCTFRSAPFSQARQLLGEQRVTDIAINVVLPWLYVRACAGNNERLAVAAEQRYLRWPAAEDNSVLRQARQRLLGGAGPQSLKTAAEQQGVLQIVRDFCNNSNALCQECLFPELLSALVGCE